MESKVHNRTPMTCPICFKIYNILGTHLRRKCLKHGSDDKIKETLAEAKRNLSNIASKGLGMNYHEVAALLCNRKCICNMIGFLKDRGFFIRNSPAVQSQPEKEVRILQKKIDCVRKEIGIQTEPEMTICQPESFEDPAQQPIQAMINDLDTEEERELQEQNQGEQDEVEQEGEENGATVQPSIAWNNPLRKKMTEAGMYKRHSLEKKPISEFATYLSKTLGVVRYKQEVQNVARFLYYMDNEKPSLKFLFNIQKTNEYFAKLLDIGNTHQTVFNYMKNLKRFISYLMDATDLLIKDKEAYKTTGIYLCELRVFQKRLSKGISKENISKKEKCLAEDMRKQTELESILSIAEPDFKSALNKAENQDKLTENENLTILNYLECLIVLRKLQRPGLVQNLTVDEWKRRNPHRGANVGIPVHEHKTAANQLAVLVLTVEEEKWFDIYFNRVRPTFLQGKSEIKNFFISSSGQKIHSVSQDISRFHCKFGLQAVTSQMVRRNVETFVSSKCKDSNIFSKYLSHSNHKAERLYMQKFMDDMVKASEMPILYESRDNPTTSKTEVVEKPETLPVIRSKEDEYQKFIEKYPVNVEKDPPPQKICLAESAVHGQHLYDKWRKLQYRMRVQYIIGLLQDHRPSEEEVRKCIGLQLWKKNLPRVKDILEQWKKK